MDSFVIYLTTSLKKVPYLAHRQKVGYMWFTGSCCSPIKLQIPFLEDLINPILTDHLLEVSCDEMLLLSKCQVVCFIVEGTHFDRNPRNKGNTPGTDLM